MQEITIRSTIVSHKGGVLDYVTPDGEVLASVLVPPGLHRARPYFEATPEGAMLQVGDGLVVMGPRSGYGVVPYGPGSRRRGQPRLATHVQR